MKKQNTPPDWLSCFNPEVLVWSATRYFIGRMTISTCSFAKDLARSWDKLPSRLKNGIRKELESEFKLDDELRHSRNRNEAKFALPLGHDCDREAWEMVRQAWQREDEIKNKTKSI